MPQRIVITRTLVAHESFRAAQVRGLFGMQPEQEPPPPLVADVPSLEEPWRIGAIVGPSGSGKSSLARAAFPLASPQPYAWPCDAPLIDALGSAPLLWLTHVLTAVGLGSPPSWLRPYAQLSTGEQFRAELARLIVRAVPQNPSPCPLPRGERVKKNPSPGALMSEGKSSAAEPHALLAQPLLVVDEFTSTLDRPTAEVVSIALARGIRSGKLPVRLVVVTCHEDAVTALEPDWTLNTGAAAELPALRRARGADDATDEPSLTAELSWRRPRRRPLCFEVRRCPQRLWGRFARHHYLSGQLSRGATCFAAFWEGEPVAFCAVVAQLGKAGWKRISRLVTLPERQGLGLGLRLAERVADDYLARGCALRLTTSHPSLAAALAGSPRWRYLSRRAIGSGAPQQLGTRAIASSAGRGVQTFGYLGESVASGERRAA